jgi:hypothetical protein
MAHWLDDEAQARKRKEEINKEFDAKQRAASWLLQAEIPRFWKQVIQELTFCVDRLPILGYEGTVSKLGMDVIHIDLDQPGAFANQTAIDLYINDRTLRGNAINGGSISLTFITVSMREIAVIDSQKAAAPMNPAGAAEYILRHMIGILDRQRVYG